MNFDIEAYIAKLAPSGVSEPIPQPTLNGGPLGGVECSKCNNTGRLLYQRDGILIALECECMAQRRSLRSAAKSGLGDMMQEYTFKGYNTPDDATKQAKAKATEYLRSDPGKWFYISGIPGSGKTHLCVSICSELIRKGKTVKYVLWRDIAQKLKASVNDPEYSRIINSFIRADVLYIDDFLKGSVTDADMNRAFEIINARYNMPNKRTIISSERDIKFVRSYDEATGSRIWQRSKGFCLKAPAINWRN